jgi:hypothetical protein
VNVSLTLFQDAPLHPRQIAVLELYAHGITIARKRVSRLILLEPTLALPSGNLLSSSTDQGDSRTGGTVRGQRTATPIALDPIYAVKEETWRHYALSSCFENDEQTFDQVDAGIYRTTKG